MVGLYLDALSDEQRDRVIEAEQFGNGMFFNRAGVGCLVGVAEREYFENNKFSNAAFCPPVAFAMSNLRGVGESFDRLCKRFGKARIVAACKARAARGNNITGVTEAASLVVSR